MMTKGTAFAGCGVALVTPFRDHAVDDANLRKLVDWHIEQGTPVICPCGTTGESPTLSHDEHEHVISIVIEQVAGRAKVLAGTGSNATSEAVRLTKFAARAGADGALLVAPYYNRPTQEGLYAHFAKIAEAAAIPQVLYNIPARTGRNIEPATVARLCRIAPIVAIKEAAGSLDQVSELAIETNLTILSGDDSLTIPMLSVGAEGVISVVANLIPREVMALISTFQRGDLAGARELHKRLFPLCRDLLSIATNPIPVKTALAFLGRIGPEFRLPLCPLDDSGQKAVRFALERFGLASDHQHSEILR